MSKLRLPSLLTVDAYNTLYAPKYSIPQQYNEITRKYGVELPEGELMRRYATAYKEVNSQHPNYGKHTGLSVNQFWYKVVSKLYGKQAGRGMVTEIVETFQRKSAYKVFDDFVDMSKWAKHSEIPYCVASNADSGVTHLVIEEFGMRQYFNPEDVYLSYDLECCKPDPRFFQLILEDMVKRGVSKDTETLLANAWHVGDEYDKDVECAQQLGMGTILVDRGDTILKPTEHVRQTGAKQYIVKTLYEVAKLFKQQL